MTEKLKTATEPVAADPVLKNTAKAEAGPGQSRRDDR